MPTIFRFLTAFFLLATVAGSPAQPDTTLDALKTQREQFLAARKAVQNRDTKRFRQIAGQLRDYPLYSYLEYMELRQRMFDKLVSLPARFYDHNSSGALISKVTFNATQVTDAATHVITVLVRDSLAVLGLLAWLLYLDWQLTMVALVTAPMVILVVSAVRGSSARNSSTQMPLRLESSRPRSSLKIARMP